MTREGNAGGVGFVRWAVAVAVLAGLLSGGAKAAEPDLFAELLSGTNAAESDKTVMTMTLSAAQAKVVRLQGYIVTAKVIDPKTNKVESVYLRKVKRVVGIARTDQKGAVVIEFGPEEFVAADRLPGGKATGNAGRKGAGEAGVAALKGVAGGWSSDWGKVTLQGGATITGHWDQGRGRGVIKSGSYDPKTRKLVFAYYQDWNKQNGTADLQLSADGKTLKGTWKQGNGSGTWTMSR